MIGFFGVLMRGMIRRSLKVIKNINHTQIFSDNLRAQFENTIFIVELIYLMTNPPQIFQQFFQ